MFFQHSEVDIFQKLMIMRILVHHSHQVLRSSPFYEGGLLDCNRRFLLLTRRLFPILGRMVTNLLSEFCT